MSPEQQRSAGLRTAIAEDRQIVQPVQLPATIEFDPARVAVLRAPAAARVRRLFAQPGDAVLAGQTLAELDIAELRNAQARRAAALATLRQAETGVTVVRAALHRAEILVADGALARAELERRRALLAQAQAETASAQATLIAEQAEVARLHPSVEPGIGLLASPIAGIVVSLGAAPGELLTSDTQICTIADISTVIAVAQVPESQIPLVVPGDPAELRLALGGDRIWRGQILALGAAVDPQSRTLPARIRIANNDVSLRGGMFVEATISSNRQRRNVTIPASAVQMLANARIAFTPLGGSRFRRLDLQLGVQLPDWVEVKSGLARGEAVVTEGSFTLKALLENSLLGGSG